MKILKTILIVLLSLLTQVLFSQATIRYQTDKLNTLELSYRNETINVSESSLIDVYVIKELTITIKIQVAKGKQLFLESRNGNKIFFNKKITSAGLFEYSFIIKPGDQIFIAYCSPWK